MTYVLILLTLCWVAVLEAVPVVRFNLNRGWRVCYREGSKCARAQIPGHATLDLNDVDPYRDFNELDLQEASLQNYTYTWNGSPSIRKSCTGKLSAQLIFGSIDTIAKAYCAGEELKTINSQSAFIHRRYNIDERCVKSGPTLRIEFDAALSVAEYLASDVFKDKPYPHTVNYHVWSEPTHRNLLRKPGSDFGWVSCFAWHGFAKANSI